MSMTICESAPGTPAEKNSAVPRDGIQITGEQRAAFDRDGYLVVRDAIPAGLVDRLIDAQDRVYAQQQAAGLLNPEDQSMHLMGFLHRDKAFLELLELPTAFPLVWGILGWNIHAYHRHIDVHPGHPRSHA